MIRYNEQKQANEICLIEIFKSIDGEAFHSGQATVFVRTFGCNCRCSFCDTKECWSEENFKKIYPEKELMWMTAKEIFETVEELERYFPMKSICLTGGEPLMEENKDFMIHELIPLFLGNYAINIETDGAVDYLPYKEYFGSSISRDDYGNRIGVTLITDWKLPHSKMNGKMIQSNLFILSEMDIIKMVISDDQEDWDELSRICKSGTRAKIYLSPVFGEVTMSKIPEFVFNHPEFNITCQIQSHKVFWEPTKKGV